MKMVDIEKLVSELSSDSRFAAELERAQLCIDELRAKGEFTGLTESVEDLQIVPKDWFRRAHDALHTQRSRISELEAQIEEYILLESKMNKILTNTANALKGDPGEMKLHSWHDLAEVAADLKAKLETTKRDAILEAAYAVPVHDKGVNEFVADLINYANSIG